jgi:hypothetical protein
LNDAADSTVAAGDVEVLLVLVMLVQTQLICEGLLHDVYPMTLDDGVFQNAVDC